MTSGTRSTIGMLGVALVDLAVFHTSIVLSFLIRYLGTIPAHNLTAYTRNIPSLSAVFLVSLFLCGLYERHQTAWASEVEQVAKATGIVALGTVFLIFMARSFAFPRTVIFMSWAILLMLLLLWRRDVWTKLFIPGKMSLIVVGPLKELATAYGKVSEEQNCGYCISAGITIDDACDVDSLPIPISHYGDGSVTNGALAKYKHDALLIMPGTPNGIKRDLAMEAMSQDTKVILVPNLYETFVSTSSMSSIGDMPTLRFKGLTTSHRELVIKRSIDAVIAALALFLTLPLMLVVAIGIKLSSPKGAVFLRQERIGLGNRKFILYKFRTMVPDAEEMTGPVLASEGDSRITPFGRLLRMSRIDEIPQLVNVLKGDMSLVGPRPERPHFVNQFAQEIPGYDLRHRVPAGMTGLAQVLGGYETDPGDKLTYDVAYASSWSLTSDLKIMLRTASVILARKGAR